MGVFYHEEEAGFADAAEQVSLARFVLLALKALKAEAASGATGDGEFDIEFQKSIARVTSDTLRWQALHAEQAGLLDLDLPRLRLVDEQDPDNLSD